ncbi:hypothetical protein EOL96_02115 [Candidatus Saccharibacteria bacterium]|nr:hypothetical protein [Candidatus Saccharibacteria bacterium]
MKKILIIAIAAIVVTSGAIFVIRPEIISSFTSSQVLRVTSRGGGLCDGPCPPPEVYILYEDGVYSGHSRLTADEIRQVKGFAAALAAASGPREGMCDSYVDGTDAVWIIADTQEQIVPCEYTDPSSLRMIERIGSILYR